MTTRTLFNVLTTIHFNQCLTVSPDLAVDAIISRAVEENSDPCGNTPRYHIRDCCRLFGTPFIVHIFSILREALQ
ncbi:hypothetical protein, partial [Pseudomonas syringae]|uniref:hypothetical protein n=1 Tax=Pseudomonas syringae TaxID=317 RepID=UPI001FF766BD